MFDQLIGREHAAAVLRAEIARAGSSHGGLVLVAGEAGIGKTTLVTGAAREADQEGFLVLGGACWDADNAPGYWPWTQVVRALRRTASAAEWAAVEEAAGPELDALLTEPRAPAELDGAGDDGAGDDDPDGFALSDAVTTALVTVSQRRPVLVVLDDLHWADAASLRLLRFAAQHTWFERVLLVATYRDAEVDPSGDELGGHPLWGTMTPLLSKATTLVLTGLEADEVAVLISRTVGREAAPELVAEVHRRTGGNPFFVEQTARLWHSGGAVTGIPPGVRDAVRRRVGLLPPAVVTMLAQAAVLGREFHRQVLAAGLATPTARADRLLEAAVTARLVVQRGAGRFAFAHDLVRETLYEALDAAEARRRHAAVVRALDQQPALAERVVPADLARHAHLAGDEVDPAHAVALLSAAAKEAAARLAFDEANGHRRRAYELAGAVDPRRRVMLGLELAEGLLQVDRWDEARPYFQQVLDEARAVDDPMLLARLALTLHQSRAARRDPVAELLPSLLVESHRRLLPGDPPAPEDPGDPATQDRLVRALAVRVAVLARRGQDDDTLAFGLSARHGAIWGPGSAAERAALTQEMITVGRRSGDAELEHFARSLRWVALLELGDPEYLTELGIFQEIARREAQPQYQLSGRIDLAIVRSMQGEFAESEELEAAAGALVQSMPRNRWYERFVQHLRWSRLLLRGRFRELDALLGELASTGHPHVDLLEGVTAAQRGDAETVCRVLTAADGGERYPRHMRWLWLRFLAQGTALLGERERCEQARLAVAPFADQWSVSVYGFDVGGPMALWIAELDAALGDWGPAVDGFARAALSADWLRSRPWAAEARARQAEALLARNEPGDRAEANELLQTVSSEAEALGLEQVAERVSAAREGRAGVERRAAAEAEFRFEGTVWTLRYAGRTVRLPDAKGLRDLRELLARPGSDIPAVRLLNPAGGETLAAARSLGGDPVLDDRAKAAYRRRLTQLDAEIDRAAERGDEAAATALGAERAALLEELRVAAGLGGRTRRLGDEAERARKTVTARIRDTLRRLDDKHPELAAHLRAAVATGATCGYHPRDGVAWRL
ncbi:AAA family ATPase [Streptomyces sp. NBRC 109706]|uniref:ATP-binding protein n=1 Tax=Streptomyces sp. NBRC 109706 TaxID=1550035 RepID=UPI000A8B0C08|nr:AAA family ATPase [Streptomyces sp. NBRC 109706]